MKVLTVMELVKCLIRLLRTVQEDHCEAALIWICDCHQWWLRDVQFFAGYMPVIELSKIITVGTVSKIPSQVHGKLSLWMSSTELLQITTAGTH